MGFLSRIERRSASAHPSSDKLVELFGGLSTTASGVNVTWRNARECPEVDACVGIIEDTIATVPLDFYERDGESGRKKVDDHPLHVLLHEAPNAWQTSVEFRQMMEGWRSTEGNAYAYINWRGDGTIASLEPMDPGTVTMVRTGFASYGYQWSPSYGSPRTLLPMEVLHLKDKPFRRDLIRGQSRVERHRESIGLAQATSEYLARFFSNYAVPKAFLEVPGQLSEDQIRLVREQFETRHAGLANAHKVGVMQAGIKLQTLGVDNAEAQVIEAYGLAVAKIARAWGVPLHLIGELSKQTSWGTGIEQQSIGFISYYMRPKFVAWEQALNTALMSAGMRRKFFFEFNIDGLMRGDFKSRMDAYALMIQWGLATPNEIRKLMNLPPVEGGDERLQPLNMVPASRIMDVLLKTSGGPATRDSVDIATRALVQFIEAAVKGAPLAA